MTRELKIRHPEFGEGTCMPSAREVWEDRGWEVVEDPNEAAANNDDANAVTAQDATAARNEGDSTRPAESNQ